LTRADIAKLIGRDKSFVTRKLNGDSNMTLQTLADLAFALNRPVKVKLSPRTVAVGSNRAVLEPTTSSPQPNAPAPAPPSTTSVDGITAIAA
jgi:transcriptional regulator with XRE-family HTH domain